MPFKLKNNLVSSLTYRMCHILAVSRQSGLKHRLMFNSFSPLEFAVQVEKVKALPSLANCAGESFLFTFLRKNLRSILNAK